MNPTPSQSSDGKRQASLNPKISLSFIYNDHGAGSLCVFALEHGDCCEYDARTGSRDASGELVNACPCGLYGILEEPVDTDEAAMFVEAGQGWKARLYRFEQATRLWEFTHLLIHPDGGLGGTKGCIGIIGTDAHPLRDLLKKHVVAGEAIEVIVGQEWTGRDTA